MSMTVDWLGWTATAVFFASYFCRRPQMLRVVQMCGSILWGVYGLLIGATPVVVANVLVCGAAAWTLLRQAPPRTVRVFQMDGVRGRRV
jgi:Bacterial inner membrane protein